MPALTPAQSWLNSSPSPDRRSIGQSNVNSNRNAERTTLRNPVAGSSCPTTGIINAPDTKTFCQITAVRDWRRGGAANATDHATTPFRPQKQFTSAVIRTDKETKPPLFARDSDVATVFASRSEKAFQTNT